MPPGAGAFVASAGAHDAVARANAAAPATEAIVLRLITDLPPAEKPVARSREPIYSLSRDTLVERSCGVYRTTNSANRLDSVPLKYLVRSP